MDFQFSIPTPTGGSLYSFQRGQTLLFVGANGTGKTRLAAFIESQLGFKAHRVSAHRALTLNTDVMKISEEQALRGLRLGNTDKQFEGKLKLREQFRYSKGKVATALVNDFDFMLQALFAEQTNSIISARGKIKSGHAEPTTILSPTKFDQLCTIWQKLLPHRELRITGDNIYVRKPDASEEYSASELSDGERAIFYMIGQALLAVGNSVLVVDEPELHVHPSIMSSLWDAIEAARPDCGFIFITHDLHFAANRPAQKFVIRDFQADPLWEIKPVPDNTGFGEELTTLILGSRRPVLFVEGTEESLDLAIYRSCYPEWTVVPRSSCTEVIHSVVTMRKNAELTRVTCSGLVDGDDHEEEDRKYFNDLGIQVLPVAEIENLFLLPDISSAIAKAEGFTGSRLNEKSSELAEKLFEKLNSDEKIEAVVVRYCQRRIDRILKKLDLSSAKDIPNLRNEFETRIGLLDIEAISKKRSQEIRDALQKKDMPRLLALYDDKQMLAIASSVLRSSRKSDFEGWISRSLQNDTCPELKEALVRHLPRISPK